MRVFVVGLVLFADFLVSFVFLTSFFATFFLAIFCTPRLSLGTLPDYTFGKPISFANTVRNCRNSSGLMLLFGYPRAGTEFVTQNALAELQPPRMESLKFICKESAGGWKKTELKYSPLMHLVVGMIRNGYSGKTGRNRLLPEHSGIQGISGCGIWRIADHARGKSLDQIGMADCKLIAIEHSYDEEAGKVAGTWIDLTLEVLANSFPEVKPAMGILYPR